MTATSPETSRTEPVTPVSRAMLLAMVDQARSQRYPDGVIGIRGRPDRSITAELEHEGQTVRVRPTESSLAVREVLAERRPGEWLLVVTDRNEDDLGAGILAHFTWQRLRNPDPWEAVRSRFSATGTDPSLISVPRSRDLAIALLAATPNNGWPSAPAGVLTRSHVLGAVAKTHLNFDDPNADVLGVLRWTMTPGNVTALAALRSDLGDLLVDTTLDWIARRAGIAAPPIRSLFARGELADVVPLGIVLSLLTSPDLRTPQMTHLAQLAMVRLESRWGEASPDRASLEMLGRSAGTLLADLVHDRRADHGVEQALERADVLLGQLQAEPLARSSDLLANGLRARFGILAGALRRVAETHTGASAASSRDAIAMVEAAWASVAEHRLGERTELRQPFEAAVRLARWLTEPQSQRRSGGSTGLGHLARHYLEIGSWADCAINDAFRGTDDPELSPALQAVVSAAQSQRRSQERAFAAALGAAATPGNGVPSEAGVVWLLENVLPGVVIPIAKRTPVLLLVIDGMSSSAANEILEDATSGFGWLEAAIPGADQERRTAALAVLPSLTEVSRASLLSGSLVRGQQTVEQSGYAALTHQSGKITAKLFHKKVIDTTAAGWSVSHDVGEALDDDKLSLVTVVLNTIDDALDRSDPAGTTWTVDAVKHLQPLLARAAVAGRTVVITADHGHVVERRQGSQRFYPDLSSGRSRSAAIPAQEDEVEVRGPRVLTDDHRAVLAVDDTLRYGPLKAGYHGGASAAEVVVPVAVLVREDHNPLDLALLPPQTPTWWLAEAGNRGAEGLFERSPVSPSQSTVDSGVGDQGVLFGDEPPTRLLASYHPPAAASSLARSVVTSKVYKAQRKLAGRVIVTDDHVARLVEALANANSHRLPAPVVAQSLGVPQTRLRGALAQVQQLLNVEGYAVLSVEAASGAVILDLDLLREQFEVHT